MNVPSRERLRAQIVDAYWRYRQAQIDFAAAKAKRRRPGRDKSDAEFLAKDDWAYVNAVDELKLAREEMAAYSLTLLALYGEPVPWDEHCAEAVRHTIHTTQTGGTL
jgi:hypothetical protein